MATVMAIGEVLWDVFADRKHLGGAPANVAYHLAQAGHHAILASTVGRDDLGQRALDRLGDAGVDVSLVTEDPAHATGVVQVTLDARGVPEFTITEDVAWDHIPPRPEMLAAAGHVSSLIFGTLAQRHAASRSTIEALLDAASGAKRVLDLNLRAPFYGPEIVRSCLEHATILKLSEDEARELPGLLGIEASDQVLARVAERFALERIYVTMGGRGCEVHDHGQVLRYPSVPIDVADTVGAGDAFTAALVDGELRGLDPRQIAAHATAAGAYVASRSGAMPAWTPRLRRQLGLVAPA